MTPNTDDLIVMVWGACLLVVLLAYIAREIYRAHFHKCTQPPISTDMGVLILLFDYTPMTIRELTASGVTRPRERVERLITAGLVTTEAIQIGVLYALTDAGRRRVMTERGT